MHHRALAASATGHRTPRRHLLRHRRGITTTSDDQISTPFENNPSSKKTKQKGCDTGITVRYEDEHFFNGLGHFVVGFNNLYDLFNLTSIDASLLQCWILYMMQNAWDWSEPVGFLDPHVVSMQTIKQDASFVEKYITAALLRQNNKDYIVVPFNQGYHWILLVIVPKRNKVIYLDSLISKKHDFSILKGILNMSFITYVAKGGLHKGSNTTLTHRMRFSIRATTQ